MARLWPSFTATLVATRRWRIVGESIAEVVVGTTSLTSWLMSSTTRPFLFTRGVTERITPVSFISIWLRIGAPAVSALWPDCVMIGTWSPICNRAVRLSRAMILGAETTSIAVREPSAFTAASMSPPR